MRLLVSSSILLTALVDLSAAWTVCQPQSVLQRQRRAFMKRGRALASMTEPTDIHEFDFLLHENDIASESLKAVTSIKGGRRNVKLSGDERQIVLASSTAAASTEELQSSEYTDANGAELEEDADDYDPYADVADYQQQMSKIQAIQEKPTLEERFKQMDFQDVVTTLFIPGLLSFVGLRWGFNKVANRVSENADTLLESFASEMIYHDGNEEEMRMAYKDYGRKLAWMGPRKRDAMIKRYLEAYAKRKTVSPRSIRTLSYVFALFQFSEEKTANVLVSLCHEMGTDKVSTAGKILFFGSRILRSPEGQAGLVPIKDMIKSTYRDEEVAETLVETSQQAIGEAAYRSTVLEGGKNQKKLTPGWEILGLDKETATRIFEEEKEAGFVSDRETMYGGQTTKYDSKGRAIDREGNLKNPEEAEGDEEEKDDAPPSNVYRCGNCGYTLFIAKGREFKFYGDDFKCPECGAKKDEFQPADLDED